MEVDNNFCGWVSKLSDEEIEENRKSLKIDEGNFYQFFVGLLNDPRISIPMQAYLLSYFQRDLNEPNNLIMGGIGILSFAAFLVSNRTVVRRIINGNNI